MSCPNCEKLQRLLSPLEDKVFTTRYQLNEPRDWIVRQRVLRMDIVHVRVSLVELWRMTFPNIPHTPLDLTKLGRTLQALGWSRTKVDGRLYFVKPLGDL